MKRLLLFVIMLFSSIMVVDATSISNIENEGIISIVNDEEYFLVIEGEIDSNIVVEESTVKFYTFLFLILILVILIYSKIPPLGNNKNKKDNVSFFRDIPSNNDIFRSYWLANKYGLIEKREDFMVAIFLKWLYEGNIKIDNNVNKVWCLRLIKKPVNACKMEKKLYRYMISASINGKLGEYEFEIWCRNNYKKILNWFDDVIYYETMKLLNKKEISYKKGNNMMAFSYNYFDVNSSVEDEANKLAGLRKFLENFTIINERKPLEVKLWEDYLIYAQMFGIADKVSKYFEEFYPEIIEKVLYYGGLYKEVFFVNSMIFSGVAVAKNVRDENNSCINNKMENDIKLDDVEEKHLEK